LQKLVGIKLGKKYPINIMGKRLRRFFCVGLLLGLYGPINSHAGILDDLNSAVRSYLGDKEHNQYNVLFYKEDGKEVYLGKVKGISNCQRMASSYARQHNML